MVIDKESPLALYAREYPVSGVPAVGSVSNPYSSKFTSPSSSASSFSPDFPGAMVKPAIQVLKVRAPLPLTVTATSSLVETEPSEAMSLST